MHRRNVSQRCFHAPSLSFISLCGCYQRPPQSVLLYTESPLVIYPVDTNCEVISYSGYGAFFNLWSPTSPAWWHLKPLVSELVSWWRIWGQVVCIASSRVCLTLHTLSLVHPYNPSYPTAHLPPPILLFFFSMG